MLGLCIFLHTYGAQLLEESGIRLAKHSVAQALYLPSYGNTNFAVYFFMKNYIVLATFLSKQPRIPKFNSNNLQLLQVAAQLKASNSILEILQPFAHYHDTRFSVPHSRGGRS